MSLPSITLTACDHSRLEQLALSSAQRGDKYALFLLTEIGRAKVISEDAYNVKALVKVGSWVAYWTSRCISRKTVRLMWPEDITSDPSHVSVLSNLGAALVGLRPGDRMPYLVDGDMDVLTVESVNP